MKLRCLLFVILPFRVFCYNIPLADDIPNTSNTRCKCVAAKPQFPEFVLKKVDVVKVDFVHGGELFSDNYCIKEVERDKLLQYVHDLESVIKKYIFQVRNYNNFIKRYTPKCVIKKLNEY